MNNLYKANSRIIHTKDCTDDDILFLVEYWSIVANNISEWNELLSRTLTKKDLRENYIITLAITINALGRLGRFFYDNRKLPMEKYLRNLSQIDWLRSNIDNWGGRTIRDNGKIMNNEEAVILTCSKIKQLIGIELSKEELNKEKSIYL